MNVGSTAFLDKFHGTTRPRRTTSSDSTWATWPEGLLPEGEAPGDAPFLDQADTELGWATGVSTIRLVPTMPGLTTGNGGGC